MFMLVGSLSEIVDFSKSSIYCFFRPGRLFLLLYALGDGGVGSSIVIYEGG